MRGFIVSALAYSHPPTPVALFQAVSTDWKAIKPFDSCNEIKQMLCVSEPGFYFFLGHSSLKMTERYAHLAPETQRAAAMELEGILDKI